MNSKIRAISEGAMMLAILSVFLLLDRQFAQFFEMLLFMASVPVVVYEVKYGGKKSVALCIAAMVLGFIFSTFTGMFYLASALIIGLLYGYGVNHDWKNKYLLAGTIGINFITTFLSVIVFSTLFGYDLNAEVMMLQGMFDEVSVELVSAKYIFVIVMMSYVALALMQSIVTHLFSNMMLKRFKLKTIPLHSVFDITFPKWVAILGIFAYILYAMTTFLHFEEGIIKIILIYYCIILLISVTDGAFTLICYIRLKNKGKGMIMLILIGCLLPFISNFISIIGIIDIGVGLRNKMKEGVMNEIHRSN